MIEILVALIFLQNVALGAILGRVDGGGIAKVPEWVERSLIMLYFVLACAPFAGLWSLAAYLGVVGIATGHGQYFPSMVIKAIAPERVDFIVRLFFGEDPRTAERYKALRGVLNADIPELYLVVNAYGRDRLFKRCAFGMFVNGTLVGLPAFILSMFFGQFYGALFLLTGVVKSVSYMVGWKVFKNTESAEYLNGAGRNALALSVLIISILHFLS